MTPDPPTVELNGCIIRGYRILATADYPRGVDIFFGIPFATALRFESPVLTSPPPGIMDASHPGAKPPATMASLPVVESPLTLNVFRPSPSSSSDSEVLLPVVVHVHGGAFNFGHALERELASFVSWAKRDIIAVSVSYRLGALGFPSGNLATQPLNLGLQDQKAAVEWVLRHIHVFGGSKDVTMMGISAGAHSIGHHMLDPRPLPFKKAILESGSPTARSVLSPTHSRTLSQWREFRRLLGADPTLASVHGIVKASTAVLSASISSVTWPFQPVIDGNGIIPDLPLNLWERFISSGRARDTSVILGFCSHEGTPMAPQDASTSAEFRSFFATLIPALTRSDLDSLELLYPDPLIDPASPYLQPPGIGGPRHKPYGAQFRRISEALGHYAYICPVLHTAHVLSRAGARVYLYEYAALAAPFRAASHGDHATAVSHQMSLLRRTPGLAAVAAEMTARWTSLVASPDGALSEADDEAWPLFTSPLEDDGSLSVGEPGDKSRPGQLLVFGAGNDEAAGGRSRGVPVGSRTLTDAELEQCRFWWERMELSQGMCVSGKAAKVFKR